MVLEDDLDTNRDPLTRCAPKKFWDRLWEVVRQGHTFDTFDELDEQDIRIALHFMIPAERRTEQHAEPQFLPAFIEQHATVAA